MAVRIRKELLESKQGWTNTKQVSDIIFRKGGVRYHYTHIYRMNTSQVGIQTKQKIPRKVHVNTASREEKEDFKKGPRNYLILSQ